jgi:manganese efflux pump family protein
MGLGTRGRFPLQNGPYCLMGQPPMNFGAILLLAIGLAMDATAVSATRGMAVSAIRLRHIVLVAGFFGGFQALMPLIGWFIGTRIGALVQAWDHWIAFALLGTIGAKMLWEASQPESAEKQDNDDELFGIKVMTMLAIATSIDALAVGITLPLIQAPLGISLVTIGITTALLSAVGLFAGRRFGSALGQRLDVVGGLVLIGLGAKILIEHIWGGA